MLCLGWLSLLRVNSTLEEKGLRELLKKALYPWAQYNQGKANFGFKCAPPQKNYPYTMAQVHKGLVMTWC